jgi:hypothetical protein
MWVIIITSKEKLREDMVVVNERQKILLKKRDLILEGKNSDDKENIIKITHEIAKLEDFIRTAENTLKMSEWEVVSKK